MAGASVMVYAGNDLVPVGEAISATDHGLTVGDGVFETCKLIEGDPFAFSRHLRRLARSAAALGLSCPPITEIRSRVVDALIGPSPIARGRLRITLTAGPGPLGSERGVAGPTLIVAMAQSAPWPAHIKVVTVPWVRNERSAVAGAKTTSYVENVVALRAAHARGGHEALLNNTGEMVCEGTGSNVFVERDGVLVTPPLSSGCLAGITRELFLEWAAVEGLPVVEDDVTPAQLAQAPEILLTSSTRDVQQVNQLDGRAVPGTPLGRAACELFARRAADNVDP